MILKARLDRKRQEVDQLRRNNEALETHKTQVATYVAGLYHQNVPADSRELTSELTRFEKAERAGEDSRSDLANCEKAVLDIQIELASSAVEGTATYLTELIEAELAMKRELELPVDEERYRAVMAETAGKGIERFKGLLERLQSEFDQ